VGRLIEPSRAIPALLLIILVGCGPTAQVLTTPTPGPNGPVQPTVGSQPTADPMTTPSPAPGTTLSPGAPTDIPLTTPTPFSGQVWQQLVDFPRGEALEVTSATPLADGGFYAVGFQPVPGEGYFGRREGVVWTSAEGRSWQATVDPQFQFATLEEVVELNRTVLVFGTIETCDLNLGEDCVEPPDSGWAGWRLAGGTTWERLSLPASMQAGTVDGVVAGNDRLFAFGWTGDEAQSIVWASLDGNTWTETTDLAEMDTVTAMSGGPNGTVAFGTRFASELGDLELLATVSTDAAHFGRAAAPALPAATIQAVTTGRSGLVAVGDGGDLDLNFSGVALHSPDGITWTQGSAADGTFAGAALRSVHAVPDGYVAIGTLPLPDEFGISKGASWFSSDGLAWRMQAPLGDRFSDLNSTAAGPTGVVAFTVLEEEPDDETVISTISAWFAPIEAFAAN
jgi:hypothetical protein